MTLQILLNNKFNQILFYSLILKGKYVSIYDETIIQNELGKKELNIEISLV